MHRLIFLFAFFLFSTANLRSENTIPSSSVPVKTQDQKKIPPDKDIEESDFVTLPIGAVSGGDYHVAAENIEILGTIEGDAYIAGMQVFIDGEILGDLLLTAVSATIAGKVHGNVRFVGGQAIFSGEVGKNVSVVAGSLQMQSSSVIRGNMTVLAGTTDISSDIGGKVSVVATDVRLAGKIAKTLNVIAGRLRLTSKAMVGGDLEYRGNQKAVIDPAAVIRGELIQHRGFFSNLEGSVFDRFLRGSKILGLMMNFLFTFVVGIFIMKVFPRNLKNAHRIISTAPLRAMGMGVVLLIALPLASLLLLMTVLGAPFAVALLAINILSFYTAKIFSITWGSNFLAHKAHMRAGPITVFALGLIIYYALTMIPKAGFFISFAALLLGLGAALLGRTQRQFF